MKCLCVHWEPQMKIVNAPLILQQVRAGRNDPYPGKIFVFCPWCGEKLLGELELNDGN